MIRFFRHIRKKLMEQDNTEILLLVIGIDFRKMKKYYAYIIMHQYIICYENHPGYPKKINR